MRLLPDGFDSVDELYADDQLGQQVVSVEAAPTVLCRLGEFEDHGERRLVGEASLGSHGTVADRSRFSQCAFWSVQTSVSRATVEADRPPASGPSKAASASAKSPVEMPLGQAISAIMDV